MKTVIIETTEPSRRFEIDLANEPREFVEEFQKFVSRLEVRSPALVEKKGNGSRRS